MIRSRTPSSPRPTRAVLLFVSLLATLAAVELALHLAGPGPPDPPPRATIDPYRANPYIVSYRPSLHQFIPGSAYRAKRSSYVVDYEINSLGLRGPEIGAKTLRRLVVLGDSIAEGHGVPFDDTFVSGLDRALTPEGWEVVSASIQGASTIHHAANIERTLSLDPDAVLLLVYENDLWEDRAKEAEYFSLPQKPSGFPWRLWTLVKGALGLEHDTRLEQIIDANRRVPRPEPPDPKTRSVIAPDHFAQQWEMSERYLDHVDARLTERGVPLFVANLALGTLVPRVPEFHHTHAWNLEEATRRWTERRGLRFLSLNPVAQKAFSDLPWENVMLPDDGHPTTEVHRRLAAALEPWLRSGLPR